MEQPKLIERPYQEIVDDALTAIVGGVVNEPHIFDLKVGEYPLSEPAHPARGIRSITGTADQQRRTFQLGVDYQFVAGSDTEPSKVRWLLDSGIHPDQGSQFLVDYYRPGSPSPLTDINVGSVTRTLAESISRETAVVYEQINLAYQSGFIDSAAGKSLDFVVAILDVIRKTAEFAAGDVTFFRDAGIAGSITVNAGVKVTTSDGAVTFETTNLRTLQPGQSRINVPVRAVVGGDEGLVDANEITQLLQPIAGIDRIANLDPTRRPASDETDEELRKRAKAKLRGLNLCTVAALLRAASEARAEVEIRDPQFPPDQPDKWTAPGTVEALLKDPDRFPAVQAAFEGVRAAGVSVQVLTRLVIFTPRLEIAVDPSVTPPGRVQVKQDVIAALQSFTSQLSSGDPINGLDLRGQAAKALQVSPSQLAKSAELRDLRVWLVDPEDPAQPGLRVPKGELLAGAAEGEEANLETWEFQIQTEAEGKKALPVLEMDLDDVALK